MPISNLCELLFSSAFVIPALEAGIHAVTLRPSAGGAEDCVRIGERHRSRACSAEACWRTGPAVVGGSGKRAANSCSFV